MEGMPSLGGIAAAFKGLYVGFKPSAVDINDNTSYCTCNLKPIAVCLYLQ